jgi:SAM-dependent methyltransferase
MAAHPTWEAYGCEISPAAVRYAHETLGLRNVIGGRLEDTKFPEGSFDIITIWDVIEHLLHPEPVLTHCHALLREKGICFIRTPNIEVQLIRARLKKLVRGMQPNSAYLMAHDHLHHYSMSSIRRLLERNGFSNVEFVHLHPIDSLANPFARGIKILGFGAVRALAVASGGNLNLDNLFVIAHKH